ncbi:MAG: glycosyltransferase [Anaerolineae bacterium]
MRILLVNYEFPPIGAGGGRASQKIAESLAEMGHTVRVITARPTQWYSAFGNLMLLAGTGFWVYLAYAKLSWNEDISDHGFTILGTLLLLTGFILRHTGLTWELINPIRGLLPVEFINGVEVIRVPALRQRADYCSTMEMASFLLSGAWHSLRHAHRFRPEVVHIFFGIPDGPIGWLLKRVYGLPYLISLRGADVPSAEVKRFAKQYQVLRPFIRWLWRDADAVVAVSNGLRQVAWQTEPGYPIEVIPNAVDLSVFTPPLQRRDAGPVQLLFVGRLNAFKNVETLLEAIAHLLALDVGPFTLEIVGEGERRASLEQQVVALGLTRVVRFAGWVGHPQILDHYRETDLFVTATTWEGMPNTVLEAMACGLPVVGSRAPGLDQLVEDGVNGYLVEVNDVPALADRLARLIQNGYERRRMGRESRKLAERRFAWEYIAAQYADIYRRIRKKPAALEPASALQTDPPVSTPPPAPGTKD